MAQKCITSMSVPTKIEVQVCVYLNIWTCWLSSSWTNNSHFSDYILHDFYCIVLLDNNSHIVMYWCVQFHIWSSVLSADMTDRQKMKCSCLKTFLYLQQQHCGAAFGKSAWILKFYVSLFGHDVIVCSAPGENGS